MGLGATLRHLFHPQRSNNHRPRVLHPEAYAAFIGLAILFVGGVAFIPRVNKQAGEVLGFNSSITPSDVVRLTNQEREKQGLTPLKVNSALNEAALAKAQDMLTEQYWSHNSPTGVQPWAFFEHSKYEYSVAGENLARDFSNSPDMVRAWMNSPTHRENIVHQKYQEIGVAVIDGKLQGVETTLVVQFFGSPLYNVAQIPMDAVVDESTVKKTTQQIVEQVPVISFAENQETVDPTAQVKPGRAQPAVLSGMSFRISSLTPPPLLSPLQMTKAFFLAILCIVVLTLIYDMAVMQYRPTTRMVGKNFAHIIFLFLVTFLVLYFKSGVIA